MTFLSRTEPFQMLSVLLSIANFQWLGFQSHQNGETSEKYATLTSLINSQTLEAKQDLRRLKVQELLAYIQECYQHGVAVDIGKAAFSTSLNLLSSTMFFVDLANPRRELDVRESPNLFKPDRFLDSDIDVKGRNFELIPFGAGRPICPGMPLALGMVHLMLASLIHSFDWKLEGGVLPPEMDMEDKFGITLGKDQPLGVIPIPVQFL
ncbi:hypothetical protein GH714_009676 [Hevea brasiliensis]|uniref:Cytochrome P450 n=1 Tax=Hevea brasiliensis TaxID=3981 RepID=A0A6A6ML16_HEVBR|nr:hypothetical protein GH714_009676 [Hevea brasiliensis]